jgi:hypothetical protein
LKSIRVKWIDASYSDEEHARGDRLKPGRLRSEGILMENHADYITITQDLDEDDGSFRHVKTIPRINIISIEELEPKQKTGG